MRDEQQAKYEAALKIYEKEMESYKAKVLHALATAEMDITKYGILHQEHDEWSYDDEGAQRVWDWYAEGIRVKVDAKRPKKPEPVTYRLRQCIEMLERSVQDKFTIDENHILTRILIRE